MHRVLKLLHLLLSLAGVTLSAEIFVAPKIKVWEEFDRNGSRLLQEAGVLLSVGIRGDVDFFMGEVETYAGTIRYDGQTQAGVPVETDTNYAGISASLGVWKELGNRWKARFELLYHTELWVRDIESTATAVGYQEVWFFDTIDLGLRLTHNQLYTFGRYRLMFRDARMQASLTGIPELRPKKGISYEFGFGVKGKSLGVELVYGYTKFNRSEPEPYGTGFVLQPESVRETLSVRAISYF